MSAQQYQLTEPHPSVPKSHYIFSGRGGAGNKTHVNPVNITPGQTAMGPPSLINLKVAPHSAYYTAGRGGAGNLHRESERAIFSFDEELERQRKMMEHQAPLYHVGRGGAGNWASEDNKTSTRRDSHSSSRSDASVRRSLEGVVGKLRSSLSRNQ